MRTLIYQRGVGLMRLGFLKAGYGPLSGSRSLSSDAMNKFQALEVKEAAPFVYQVSLNRPEKRNALNKTMWHEIGAVFEELAHDEDCRAIVLTGNGPMFTAGIDLNDLTSLASVVTSDDDVAKKAKVLYKTIRDYQIPFNRLEECSKPVIAAVHNACVGGGVDLITAADIRICTQDTYFQVKEVDVGLAADVGTLQRLPKVLGNQSLVRELCFTARKFPSDEAKHAGFVSQVYPDKETMLNEALSLAKEIAEKSPVAVQGTKSSLIYARDHSVEDGLEQIARWNMTMLQSKDLMTSAMAMMTKQKDPPTFSKL
ncbi:hypothetical protein TCAL_03386 [Tigriopus californicus]|uniref:Delta(3,5)-Delta(2,4)-dienoyl-CoA isomerase, mitochondrial n=1 Tax=Tigriopus californicus TaxID=6832 RepID=A0A553P2U5_TIGCA|nr:delta(3,5)-Delta(2,4)-dienoyl-CoA isomerase, mitochondrial-like [Tigriopus californicus]TRY72018.1 hypothetical protein TCAL_03386 [Tigriopus californicus]